MIECWFLGTLIYWVGYTSQHGIPASSTYSIDGQTPISFPVPASPDTYFNQILFKTEQLSFGQHKLADTGTYLVTAPRFPLHSTTLFRMVNYLQTRLILLPVLRWVACLIPRLVL